MTIQAQRRLLVVLAAATYLASLALPAYFGGTQSKAVYGGEVLVTGFIGIAIWEFRWLANLPFLYVVLARAFDRRVFLPKFLGAVLALTALSLLLPPPHPMMRFAIGAYVWGASLLLAATLCFRQPALPESPKPEPP